MLALYFCRQHFAGQQVYDNPSQRLNKIQGERPCYLGFCQRQGYAKRIENETLSNGVLAFRKNTLSFTSSINKKRKPSLSGSAQRQS